MNSNNSNDDIAQFVSVSQPKIEGIENPEDLIAYCARVSNPSNQSNTDTAPRLLKYLIKHKHWSPFEMVSMTLEINTTRDIARQILRHRSFSFQEFSTRYAEAESEMSLREARLQDSTNRQNSLPIDDDIIAMQWELTQKLVWQNARQYYQWALEKGIAKEQARALLPEGLAQSRLYMAGTIRSWIHYIDLRSGPETQREHREVALACQEIMASRFPAVAEALDWEKTS